MSEDPKSESPAESKPAPAADGNAPQNEASSTPILIEDVKETDALEELVNESYPPIKAPPIKELLDSPDHPTRFMVYLSAAFGILAFACMGILIAKYIQHRRSHQTVAIQEPKNKAEPIITQSLGEFKLILKGADHPNEGELRVDVVAECSTQDACDYIKEHNPQVRDIVIPVLVNLRREDVLKPETKNLIRRKIAEQLNSLPMKGKIIQILFTDMTIENTN